MSVRVEVVLDYEELIAKSNEGRPIGIVLQLLYLEGLLDGLGDLTGMVFRQLSWELYLVLE